MPALVAGIGVFGGALKQRRQTKPGRDGGAGSNPPPLAAEDYSAFSPASLMTFPHLSISDLKNAAHCSGELPIGA
jgi:hypothetical protein